MIDTIISRAIAPRAPRRPIDDPLLAAGARILASLPHLLDRHRRPTIAARFAVARIVHVADMIHVGEHGTSFLRENAEATSYGPLHPRLFEAARTRELTVRAHYAPLDSDARRCVDQACQLMGGMTAGAMIAFTHAPDGAWARRYVPGPRTDRGPMIRIADLAAEYAAHTTVADGVPA